MPFAAVVAVGGVGAVDVAVPDLNSQSTLDLLTTPGP